MTAKSIRDFCLDISHFLKLIRPDTVEASGLVSKASIKFKGLGSIRGYFGLIILRKLKSGVSDRILKENANPI